MNILLHADKETVQRVRDLRLAWTRSPEEIEVMFCMAEEALKDKGIWGVILANTYCEPVGHA